MYYLINNDAKRIIGKYDSAASAEEAGKKAKYDFHVVNDSKFEGCTLNDLAAYYNALPFTKTPIERFRDKATGISRINEAIQVSGVSENVSKKKKAGSGKRGRSAGWDRVELAAAGKKDDLRFHRESPRFKIFDQIKSGGDLSRDSLIERAKELGISKGATMAAVGKLAARGLVKLT